MRQFNVLFIKEWREAWRSYKFIWIPLVFLSLGVSDPLMNYFMKDILDAVGNLPEGFEMILPDLMPEDLIVASTSQFQSIGIIVLIAVFAGAISRERAAGTATLLYVRPISFASYYLSKLTVVFIVVLVAMLLGYAGSAYYTTLLYGQVNWISFIGMLAIYALWLLWLVTFTLAMSALFSTAIAATISIIVGPIFIIIDSLLGSYWTVSPWKLSTYAMHILRDDVNKGHLLWSIVTTVICIIIFVCIGIYGSKKNASRAKI